MLKLAEFPSRVRTILGWIYFVWAVAVTVFTAYVVIRSLDFDNEVEPTTVTVMLLAGLLVAPLLPFARRLLLPGGGVVDLNTEETVEMSRTAVQGITQATPTLELPPLGSEWEDEVGNG